MNSNFQTIFHSIIFAYFYLLVSLIIPTDFSVTTPNKTRIAETVIEIEGVKQSPHFHTVSVISLQNITPFQRFIYELDDAFTVEKMSVYAKEIDFFENIQRGLIQKYASIDQAIITAYTLAQASDPSIAIEYEWVGMIVDYRLSKHQALHIGDVIIKMNGQTFDSYEAAGNYFRSFEGIMHLKVLRNDAIIDVHIFKDETDVFSFYPKYRIIATNPQVVIPGENILSGGPSAGMMYTLSLYFGLIEYDTITVDIVGTGTIRYNNKIGAIGGLRQKVITAIREGKQHFILPASQYHEVENFQTDIHLYPVDSIDEAMSIVYEIT